MIIEIFCAARHNFLRMQKRWAAMKLQLGAVAFGEHHDKPDARAVIGDLILDGAVSKLFLEMGDMELSDFGIGGHGTMTMGEYLRDRTGIANLGDDPLWDQITPLFNILDRRHMNPISFEGLVKNAVEAGVEVFFYDTAPELKPTSQKGMKNRNRTMGEVFKAHSSASDPGAVMLIGAAHLYPTKSGGLFLHTLQQQCGIGFNYVCDLSK